MNKRPDYNNKLTKTDFFDVYGISLLSMRKQVSQDYLLYLLLPIAEKYYDITYHAITSELRYFLNGGNKTEVENIPENNDYNKKLLKRLKIKNWKKSRKEISLDKIYILFDSGRWCSCYGGELWADIVIALKEFKNLLRTRDVDKICMGIDRLNDLEHNTSLYLSSYSTFSLNDALDCKMYSTEQETYKYCSEAVQELLKLNINE